MQELQEQLLTVTAGDVNNPSICALRHELTTIEPYVSLRTKVEISIDAAADMDMIAAQHSAGQNFGVHRSELVPNQYADAARFLLKHLRNGAALYFVAVQE